MERIKLSSWAKNNGISYKTAWRMFKAGTLPVPTYILPTGRVLVSVSDDFDTKSHVIYARVSSHDQREDLERQLDRIRSFCYAQGMIVTNEIKEIGSGLNGSRKKLIKLLSDPSINIIVEHKDRLTRFGFDYISASLSAQGRKIIVINDTENKLDLVQDFIDVVTSMCARIYGRRSAKNKALKALEATRHEDNTIH